MQNIKAEKSTEEKQREEPTSPYNYKMKVPGLLRIFVALLLFFVELAFFVYLSLRIVELGVGIIFGLQIFGLAFVIYLSYRYDDDSYLNFWKMFILFSPALGLLLYHFWGRKKRYTKQRKRFADSQANLQPYRKCTQAALEEIPPEELSSASSIQLRYLANKGFPLYTNTQLTYFASGESQFESMFEDIKQAQNYIFLEYYIVAEGYILEEMAKLLCQKAKEGLEIRFLCDDFGSTARTDSQVMQNMRENGVKIINFNPVLRYASGLYRNYRNHQKVCIIDGQVAWIGGTNLADEYANIYERFGYWKDTALRLEGEACRSAIADFLLLWEHDRRYPLDENYQRFFPSYARQTQKKAAVIPYWSGPLGQEDHPAADIFHSLFSTARESLYIITPYFILDSASINRICQAAESGVDVRLITPGIPDKKLIFIASRSCFGKLLRSGCRVYEYTPGFIHAKTVLADRERAVLGSINLDYRSLYLNFENAAYIYKDPVLKDIEQDIFATMAESNEVTYEVWKKRSWRHKMAEPFLKIIAPLL